MKHIGTGTFRFREKNSIFPKKRSSVPKLYFLKMYLIYFFPLDFLNNNFFKQFFKELTKFESKDNQKHYNSTSAIRKRIEHDLSDPN